MLRFKFLILTVGVGLLLSTSNLYGQTLFEAPDTAPGYYKYPYIEDCLQAALRLNQAQRSPLDSIWMDTVAQNKEEFWKKKMMDKGSSRFPRPNIVVETAKICLKKFNQDTVKVVSPGKINNILQVLLIANRDDDAKKITGRVLDQFLTGSKTVGDPKVQSKNLLYYKLALWMAMESFASAKPSRYETANYYIPLLREARKKDSLYYLIDIELSAAEIAKGLGDSAGSKEAQRKALELNDSTPVKERHESPGANVRLEVLKGIVINNTRHEALDSIAVSTLAYNLWLANTIKQRVFGGDIVTREKAQPKPLPDLGGAFYYSGDSIVSGSAAAGLASYTLKGSVPKGEFPFRNKINYLYDVSGFCHPHTIVRQYADRKYQRWQCFRDVVRIRKMAEDYPEIELTAFSITYGTVGRLGPLTPAQEADTIAKLILGHYKFPGRLVVEQTEYFHLAAPDKRRIDIPTPNSEALGTPVLAGFARMTDKEGFMIEIPDNMETAWFTRFYEILRDRKTPSSPPK